MVSGEVSRRSLLRPPTCLRLVICLTLALQLEALAEDASVERGGHDAIDGVCLLQRAAATLTAASRESRSAHTALSEAQSSEESQWLDTATGVTGESEPLLMSQPELDGAVSQSQGRKAARTLPRTLFTVFGLLLSLALVRIMRAIALRAVQSLQGVEQQATAAWIIDVVSLFVCLCFAQGSVQVIELIIMTQEYKGGMFPAASCVVLARDILVTLTGLVLLQAITRREVPEPIPDCGVESLRLTDSYSSTLGWLKWTPPIAIVKGAGAWCYFSSIAVTSSSARAASTCLTLLPTAVASWLLCGWPLGWFSKPCTWQDAASGVLITVLAAFVAAHNAHHAAGLQIRDSIIGFGVLGGHIVCEALTVAGISWIFTRFSECTIVKLMVALGALGCLQSIITVHFNIGFGIIVTFLAEAPVAIVHLLAFGLCSLVAILVQLYTIFTYGPIVFATMLTLQEVLKVLFSAWMLGLDVHWKVGIVAIFLAVAWRPLADGLSGCQSLQCWRSKAINVAGA